MLSCVPTTRYQQSRRRTQCPELVAGEITSFGSGQPGSTKNRGSSKKASSDSKIGCSAGTPSKAAVESLHGVDSPPQKLLSLVLQWLKE